jgi:hypothetical protein
MPKGYGGLMTEEQVADLNQLFVELEATVTDKQLRKALEKVNRILSDSSGGVIAFVNWNS